MANVPQEGSLKSMRFALARAGIVLAAFLLTLRFGSYVLATPTFISDDEGYLLLSLKHFFAENNFIRRSSPSMVRSTSWPKELFSGCCICRLRSMRGGLWLISTGCCRRVWWNFYLQGVEERDARFGCRLSDDVAGKGCGARTEPPGRGGYGAPDGWLLCSVNPGPAGLLFLALSERCYFLQRST